MPTFLRRHLALTGAIFAALTALSAPTFASTTYTYAAPWTGWMDSTGLNRALYAGLDGSGIKFEFTTAAPLTNFGCLTVNCNPADALAQVTSWHYHGGSAFMNIGSDTGGTLTGLLLSTDASGAILNNATDRFYVSGPVVIPGLEAYQSTLSEAHDGYDQQLLQSSFPRFYQCYGPALMFCSYPTLVEGMSNMRGAGTWTVTSSSPPVTAVPEPQAYAMVLAGLALLAVMKHRRQHS